ncbi:MAG: YHYH protein [Halieaceae bacterium]|nr:YHYH protein [Halieaceae bacterium]
MLSVKNILVSATLIFSHCALGDVNCAKETVILKTQNDIDSFQLDYGICDVLLGSLTIRESVDNNIKDLLGLNGLKIIKGSLVIESNNSLKTLKGLESLVTIGSNLTIFSNSSLSDINSLSNLIRVTGTLLVDSNDALNSSAGIENLKQLGKLQIRNNDILDEISSFSNLYGITELDIYNNDALSTLSALENLVNVSGDVRLQDNRILSDLTEFKTLSFIGGGLEINNNSSLSSLAGLEGVISISESLKILSNSQLNDCEALVLLLGWPGNPSEGSVGGSIEITDNKSGCSSSNDILANSSYEGPEKYTIHTSSCKAANPGSSSALQSKEDGLTNTDDSSIDIICPVLRVPINHALDSSEVLLDIALQAMSKDSTVNKLSCELTQSHGDTLKPREIDLEPNTPLSLEWKKLLPINKITDYLTRCSLPPSTLITSIKIQASFGSQTNHSVSIPDITDKIFKNASLDCASYANNYTGTALDQGRSKYFSSSISITADDDKCVIDTNGIPNHKFNDSGINFVNNVNAVNRSFSFSRKPMLLDSVTQLSQSKWDAVMLNGVTVDLLSAGCYRPNDTKADSSGNVQSGCLFNEEKWLLDPLFESNNFGTDSHNAHAQPDGTYHYHGNPLSMFENESSNQESPIIGFAADGFPISGSFFLENGIARKALSSYRLKNEGGSRPGRDDTNTGGNFDGTYIQDYEYIEDSGDLDECNGMVVNGSYRYYITETYPWILGCFRGGIGDSFDK